MTSSVEHRHAADMTQPQDELLDLTQLREGLEQVMPATLVQASEEAAERVSAVTDVVDPAAGGMSTKKLASTLAAALGTIAPAATAAAVASWLTREPQSRLVFPRWLRPRIDSQRPPKLTTMTSFANDRSRMVREVIEESTPVLISRHGQVLAAVIPLEPGAFEAAVYDEAGRARLAIAAAVEQRELDDETLKAIDSASDPAKEAAARGIDTSDWASLNPPE